MKKTSLITSPPDKAFFSQKPLPTPGSKIKSSSPAHSFLCSRQKTPALLAITTERNLIYFWRFICAFIPGPVFNTPEWPSSGQPAPSSCSFSMPPAPTHAPSILTLILSTISFLALLEMDHSTQTVLIRGIALPCLGPLGLPTLQCKHLLQGFNLDI